MDTALGFLLVFLLFEQIAILFALKKVNELIDDIRKTVPKHAAINEDELRQG